LLLALVSLLSLAQTRAALQPDAPATCSDCAEWNQPHEPFRVFGNTYYVGTAGLSAVLVTSEAGSILLDGGLPQSAPLIDASIRKLGFRTEDIRVIVNSHEHYDHAGGIAAIQRFSGAIVAASAPAARALEQGEPTTDDPQYGFGRTANAFPAVKQVRVVADGEAVRVGNVAVTPHFTPGHTPGSTTWTWQSCEGPRCLNVVYADSLTAVSAPGFRFTATVDRFLVTIAKVEKLPCDILLSTHPAATGMAGKLAQWKAEPGTNPLIDANACRAYARGARERLEQRVAEEKKPV
jgi:metallo-beta-lactamase class B